MSEPDHAAHLRFPVAADGRIPRDAETLAAVREVVLGVWSADGKAHGETGAAPRVDRQAGPEYSPLLRAPLSQALGGQPHRGIDVFTEPDDPDYRRLLAWVGAEIARNPEPAPALSPAQTLFRDEVVDVFRRNGCFVESCHGPNTFNDLKLIAPLAPLAGSGVGTPARLSPRMLEANRRVALGKVCRFVNLGGDLARSRLLVKNLPISEGGVHQRGGNRQFFESLSDPDVEILLQWMRLEREELAARLRSGAEPIDEPTLGRLRGIAFLQGPRDAPRRFFDLQTFHPGTRLMVLPEGADTPHDLLAVAGAEIQAFDVRHDGRAIVLSMRTSADSGFALYQLPIDESLRADPDALERLSPAGGRLDDGALLHHIDPIYAPDPVDVAGVQLDRVVVVYASNQVGTWALSSSPELLGEADGGDPSTLIDHQRTEAAGTFDGRALVIVDGPHRGEQRRIVRHEAGGRLTLDRALPSAPDARTVYTIDALSADYRPAFDLWRAVPDRFAQSARRMTFTSAQERRPTMRTSGEVMFTSVRNRGYQADRPVFNGAIYRIMAGGFDYHIQGGNRSRYPLLLDSRELASGLEVRLAIDPRNLWGGGALLLNDHGFGPAIEPDNPMDRLPFTTGQPVPESAGVRYLPAAVPVLPETGPDAVPVTGVAFGGAFRDPWPMPDGTILAAWARGPFDHLDPTARPDFNIVRLRFPDGLQSPDGQRAGRVVLEPVAAAGSPGFAETNPRPIMVRLKAKAVTHQKLTMAARAAHPKRIDGVLRASPGAPGEIECYDYPLLQSFLNSFAPAGARAIRDDDLRWVRIVEQVPPTRADVRRVPALDPAATPVSIGVHERQRILAEIPLEPDGSFYARVPSETPLIIQGLDKDRMALHSMSRWFYLHPGERLTFSIPRSIFPLRCAGCHGSLTGRPADGLGPPDLVSGASRVLANWDATIERARPPAEVAPIEVDFRRDVQPVLDRRCAHCHGASAPDAGLDLSDTPSGAWTTAYRSLLSGAPGRRRFVNEREGLAAESPLLEKLTGRELRAPGTVATPGLPHPTEAGLTPDELLTLVRWIDLGCPFEGGSQQAAP